MMSLIYPVRDRTSHISLPGKENRSIRFSQNVSVFLDTLYHWTESDDPRVSNHTPPGSIISHKVPQEMFIKTILTGPCKMHEQVKHQVKSLNNNVPGEIHGKISATRHSYTNFRRRIITSAFPRPTITRKIITSVFRI